MMNSGLKFLDYFQHIYIINLLERPDRKKEVIEQLAYIGLDPDIHKNIKFFHSTIPESPGEFESKGARGCFMSHLSVLKMASENNLSRVLIFEDDINFTHNFKKCIDNVISELKISEWGIFYGDCSESNFLFKKVNSAIYRANHLDEIRLAHFVAFQGNTILEMVSFLELLLSRKSGDPVGGPMHVDGAYTVFRKNNPDCQVYISSFKLAYQRSSRSDISLSNFHKSVDKIKALNHLMQAKLKSYTT